VDLKMVAVVALIGLPVSGALASPAALRDLGASAPIERPAADPAQAVGELHFRWNGRAGSIDPTTLFRVDLTDAPDDQRPWASVVLSRVPRGFAALQIGLVARRCDGAGPSIHRTLHVETADSQVVFADLAPGHRWCVGVEPSRSFAHLVDDDPPTYPALALVPGAGAAASA
jgi:hypothetical protein